MRCAHLPVSALTIEPVTLGSLVMTHPLLWIQGEIFTRMLSAHPKPKDQQT